MPRELTANEQIDLGRAEAERLRGDRVRNYEVKRAAGFRCQSLGCNVTEGLLVVAVDGGYQARCRDKHVGNLTVTPGQWVDRA